MAVALRIDDSSTAFGKPESEAAVTMQEEKQIRDINLHLGFELVRKCLEDPVFARRIPDDGSVIHILANDHPQAELVNRHNRRLAERETMLGKNVVAVLWANI